jgi:hypothetical protein
MILPGTSSNNPALEVSITIGIFAAYAVVYRVIVVEQSLEQ